MSERTKAEARFPSSAKWQALREAIAGREPTGDLDRVSFIAVQRVRDAFAAGAACVTLMKGDQELDRIYANEFLPKRR